MKADVFWDVTPCNLIEVYISIVVQYPLTISTLLPDYVESYSRRQYFS